jgi:hypothetical protein
MKSFKYLPFAALLILSLSFSAFPKSGTISTTRTGTISTTRTGTISTTATGTISTTRFGTISTTRTLDQSGRNLVAYRADLVDLLISLLTAW